MLWTIILSKWLNSSIWFIDETLTGTATPGQSGPESNDNEEVFHFSKISWTEASLSDAI